MRKSKSLESRSEEVYPGVAKKPQGACDKAKKKLKLTGRRARSEKENGATNKNTLKKPKGQKRKTGQNLPDGLLRAAGPVAKTHNSEATWKKEREGTKSLEKVRNEYAMVTRKKPKKQTLTGGAREETEQRRKKSKSHVAVKMRRKSKSQRKEGLERIGPRKRSGRTRGS